MGLRRDFRIGFRRGWSLFWAPLFFFKETRKPWHIRIGKCSRAYIQSPRNPVTLVYIWLRGWRHTHWTWWSKGNVHQRELDRK